MHINPKSKSIEEKIRLSYKWLECFEDKLKKCNEFSDLLKEYKKAILKSYKIMKHLGIIEICKSCAENTPGGSCCGKGIEDWYDEYLLLTNLLLGIELPKKRFYSNGCLFLGPKGCTLLARHDFCINYLCFRIKKALSAQQLNLLTATYGKEIYYYITIEQFLRKFIIS